MFRDDELITRSLSISPIHNLSTTALEQRLSSILLPASSSQSHFRNWGGTFHTRPARTYSPQNTQHVLDVVELARRKRVQLRAVGRAHSPSDLPFTKGWVLRTESLKGALEIDGDSGTATFLAGTYISDIHDRLAAHSPPLALGNVGSISEQTIGGLISTASHGTGISLPVISAAVQEINLVIPLSSASSKVGGGGGGGAQLVACSRTLRPELFNATLCGLGATGIIVSVKFNVVPAFRLKQAWEEIPFDSIFGTEAFPSSSSSSSSSFSASSKMVSAQEHGRVLQSPVEEYVGSGPQGKLSIGRLIALDEALPPSPFRFAPAGRSIPSPNVRSIYPLNAATPRSNEQEKVAKSAHSRLQSGQDEAPWVEEDAVLDEETERAQRTLEGVVESAKHTRIMWFPQSHMCTVMRAEPTEQAATPSSWSAKLHHRIVGYHLTQFLLFVARYHSALPIPVARLVFKLTHPAIPDEVKAGMLLRVPEEERMRHVHQEQEQEQDGQAPAAPAPALPERPEFLSQSSEKRRQQGFSTGERRRGSSKEQKDHRPTRLELYRAGSDTLKALNPAHAHGYVIDSSWRILNMDCLFPQYTNEWALPYAYAAPCIRAMREWLQEEERQTARGARIHFPIEIRFTDADGIWLSPAQGRKTCYIGIIQFRPYNLPVRYRTLWARYERLLRYFGGRPHWAKTHTCGKEELGAVYPHLEDWLSVREEVDPERVLANPYVRRHLLGEVGEAVDSRTFKSRL
ncbi:D-arabinono-1,4-lactone oxidase [Tilletia horrida]|nr:D-arabinono-1,4-lactone oxidase [Tilletia horrida]